ncbi:hypothetical protein ABW636_15610 [Aquimarina sp. 2201CG1-2-11]|uniref:hypothetical protein n=1 Tax=Aquimarina discodermiae TaxID=3231043 RepID=UPI0034631898
MNKDSEGIHVINKTVNLFTITDSKGVFFINAAIGDVIVLSSVQYDLKIIKVDNDIYLKGELHTTLKENLTELDDVIVGVQLSGNLNKDLKKIEVKELFSPEDVGIPEYHGVREEKIVPMHRAIKFYGVAFAVDIDAVYKNLSGYYKTLKATRKMDRENTVLEEIQNFYGKGFLTTVYKLPKEKLHEFLLFCIETSTIQSEFANENHNLVLKIFSDKRKAYVLAKE